MAILAISTDWGIYPRIVRIVTDDNLASLNQVGYLNNPTILANIQALQNGTFQWTPNDLVAISYAGGKGLFNVDYTVNFNFTALSVTSFATLVVSPTMLEAAYATPQLMIPAQGANTVIVLTNIFDEFVWNTTQYTGGGALGLQYGNTAHLGGTAASSTIAGATIDGFTADNFFTLTPEATGVSSTMTNMGIYLSNGTAAFATGDGYLSFSLTYQVVNTAI